MPDIFVAERVANLPFPYVASAVEHCESCNAEIWIDYNALPKAFECRRLCGECVAQLTNGRDVGIKGWWEDG